MSDPQIRSVTPSYVGDTTIAATMSTTTQMLASARRHPSRFALTEYTARKSVKKGPPVACSISARPGMSKTRNVPIMSVAPRMGILRRSATPAHVMHRTRRARSTSRAGASTRLNATFPSTKKASASSASWRPGGRSRTRVAKDLIRAPTGAL